MVDAEEGTYYLLLECRQTLDNLGLTLTLGDTDYLRWGTPSVKLYVGGITTNLRYFPSLQKDGGVEERPA